LLAGRSALNVSPTRRQDGGVTTDGILAERGEIKRGVTFIRLRGIVCIVVPLLLRLRDDFHADAGLPPASAFQFSAKSSREMPLFVMPPMTVSAIARRYARPLQVPLYRWAL